MAGICPNGHQSSRLGSIQNIKTIKNKKMKINKKATKIGIRCQSEIQTITSIEFHFEINETQGVSYTIDCKNSGVFEPGFLEKADSIIENTIMEIKKDFYELDVPTKFQDLFNITIKKVKAHLLERLPEIHKDYFLKGKEIDAKFHKQMDEATKGLFKHKTK